VKILIAHGANINQRDELNSSALEFAIFFGFSEIARYLRSHGAEHLCVGCGRIGESEGKEESADLKMCSRCRWVRYCSKECQKEHWPVHRPDCKPMNDRRADEELRKEELKESQSCYKTKLFQ
jgi:ankyrin repeat protein